MKSTDQRRHKIVSKTDLKFQRGYRSCQIVERTRHASVHSIKKSAKFIHVDPLSICNHLLLIWFFILCSVEFSIGVPTTPANCAVAKGERVQLKCSWDDGFSGYWYHYEALTNKETKIYKSVILDSLYSVDASISGHADIIFASSERTSGRYKCHPDIASPQFSAEVIALDPQPTCSKHVQADIINATCTIGFSGNWPPEIQWRRANGTLEATNTSIIPNRRATSSLIVPINETDPISPYTATCSLKFNIKEKPNNVTSVDVPVFSNTCTLTIGPQEEEQPSIELQSTPHPSSSISAIMHHCQSLHLCQCLVTWVFIRMPYKWFRQCKVSLM